MKEPWKLLPGVWFGVTLILGAEEWNPRFFVGVWPSFAKASKDKFGVTIKRDNAQHTEWLALREAKWHKLRVCYTGR